MSSWRQFSALRINSNASFCRWRCWQPIKSEVIFWKSQSLVDSRSPNPVWCLCPWFQCDLRQKNIFLLWSQCHEYGTWLLVKLTVQTSNYYPKWKRSCQPCIQPIQECELLQGPHVPGWQAEVLLQERAGPKPNSWGQNSIGTVDMDSTAKREALPPSEPLF